jgi:hypothetical protein
VSENDISDFAYALPLPYVGASTINRNNADPFRRACQRLNWKNPAINYEERYDV